MRLTLKAFLWSLPVIGVVLVACGVLFVRSIERVVDNSVEQSLHFREVRILHNLELDPERTLQNKALTNTYSITEVIKPFYGRLEKDTVLYDEVDQQMLPYRQLTFGATVGLANYMISVRKQQVNNKQLEEVISRNMAIIFALTGISLVLFVLVLSNYLWKPFYKILDQLTRYQLNTRIPLKLEETSTMEFNQLKLSLEAMSAKIRDEFLQLKEFTENVSHEIRTPVAVIKARADILLQSEGMNEDDLRTIVSIQQATDRLTKMTEGLMLLVRIDRGSFDVKEAVDFEYLFKQKKEWFDDLIQLKDLNVEINAEGQHLQHMNGALAETLVRNLLSNAIKYNVSKGDIKIHLQSSGFTIDNTAEHPEPLDRDSFQRYHALHTSMGLGLGLSIIEKICSREEIKFHYEYHERFHRFVFEFKNPPINRKHGEN